VLLDPDAEIVTEKFGTKLFPETWFIDADGVIRARFDGERDWASPLVIDLAEGLHGQSAGLAALFGSPCPAFSRGKATGDAAGVCGDLDFQTP